MNINRFRFAAGLAVTVAIACATSATAATLQMGLEYVASYTSDFEDAGYTLIDGMMPPLGMVDPTDIHQFQIWFQVDPSSPPDPGAGNPVQGQVAENSLGLLIVDVVLGPGLMPDPNGYYPIYPNPVFDPPPPGAAGGASRGLYTDNSDGGDPDLRRIILITDALAAHGRDPGEAGPTLMGGFFVNWDGHTMTSLSVQPAASAPVDPWLLWSGGWIDTVSPYTHSTGTLTVMGPEIMFRSVNPAGPTDDFDLTVPEPASVVLAGVAIMGVITLVRRRG